MDRRTLLQSGLAMGAALPFAAPARLLAAETEDAALAAVAPELRPMAKHILRLGGSLPTVSRATLAQTRASSKSFTRPPLADVPHEKRVVPGKAGTPDVVVYVANAKPGASRPGILHIHGGGYVAGSAESSISEAQELGKTLDCTVVTVEYRLSPETTYAGSVEDCYAALQWLHGHAGELGVDPARLAVYGASAGGGLGALVAIAARDRGEVRLAFQCLTYPMLDDRTGSSRSVPPHVGKLIWTAASNRFGWESFLGAKPGGASAPRGAVPARVQNLAGLPPAWIGVGTIDLFHDEDVDYAQRLNAAGVPCELLVVPGAFHGFDGLPARVPLIERFRAARLNALRGGLGIA